MFEPERRSIADAAANTRTRRLREISQADSSRVVNKKMDQITPWAEPTTDRCRADAPHSLYQHWFVLSDLAVEESVLPPSL
jgi:hypothetical protein